MSVVIMDPQMCDNFLSVIPALAGMTGHPDDTLLNVAASTPNTAAGQDIGSLAAVLHFVKRGLRSRGL